MPESEREPFNSVSADSQATPGDATEEAADLEASDSVYGMPAALVDRTDNLGIELAAAWKAVLERAWQSDKAISFAFDYDPDLEAIVVDIDKRVPDADVDALHAISDRIQVNLTDGGFWRRPALVDE